MAHEHSRDPDQPDAGEEAPAEPKVSDAPPGLRGAAMHGGALLAGRHALSLGIHLVGVTLLTRAIGPHDYGIYVGALGVQTYLYAVTQLGVVVYLIRHAGDLGDREFDQAFTLLAAVSLGVALLVFATLPTLEGWLGIEAFAQVGRALVAVLPVQLVATIPLGRLERALNYRAIAPAELAGYAAFYIVALPLAYRGFGEWAPVAGYWVQQGLLAALLYRMARYRPRLRWEPPLIREMLRYGFGYSGAYWIWQMRDLVNPLIVGRFAGATAVALVALTIRLVDALSFLKGIGWRVSLAVLGKLQADYARMVRAASDGMRLQVLSLGIVLAGFGLVSDWAVRRLFGEEWLLVTALYPFVALSYLTNAVFQLEAIMLNVIGRTRQVAEFHLLHLALFAGGALLLVPRMGPLGYAWSEIVALPAYLLLHAYVTRAIGRPEYVVTGLWWAAFSSLFFWRELGWYGLIAPAVALLWPGTQRELRKYLASAGKLGYVE